MIGQVDALRMSWCVVAAVGLLATGYNVAEVWRDQRVADALFDGDVQVRDVVLRSSLRENVIRGVQLGLLLAVGVWSLMVPKHPHVHHSDAEDMFTAAFVLVLVLVEAGLTINSVLEAGFRRRLLVLVRRHDSGGISPPLSPPFPMDETTEAG